MANYFWHSIVALPLLAGCYRYVPAKHTELSPATAVSVALSTRGTLNVVNRLGENVSVLEGNVTEASASSLTLALLAVRRRGEVAPSTWSGESITLSPDEIEQVRRRQLSPGRTAIASAVVGAASVGIVVGIAKATGEASGTIGGKPSPNP